jgi:hypothetical protein
MRDGEQWMNPIELAQYISNEDKVEQVLREIGILKRYATCPFCGENHVGRVRSSSLSAMVVTRNVQSAGGSILKGLKTPFTKFLMESNYSTLIPLSENQKNICVSHIKPSIISTR